MRISRKRGLLPLVAALATSTPLYAATANTAGTAAERPNILLCISDDQSWAHASAYGVTGLARTPTFDRLAKAGALFTHGFVTAPSCSPSRASLLTGRYIWQNEEAGVHGSIFPAKFPLFTLLLKANGYQLGSSVKVWGPGNYRLGGPNVARTQGGIEEGLGGNLVGGKAIRRGPEQFRKFLEKSAEKPFFFWFGSTDPHRNYDTAERKAAWGEREATAKDVPPFLPDIPEFREDLANYGFEIERFDKEVGELLEVLRETGRDRNTIVIVTSDNGMPWPRAKRECYEYGIHVPLAMSWPAKMPAGRVIDDFISLADLGPTLLEAADVPIPKTMSGRSFLEVLKSERGGLVDPSRTWVVAGKERHNPARAGNACYPVRAIRTDPYLLIWNLKPNRWPVGPSYGDIGWYYYPAIFSGIKNGTETRPGVMEAFRKGTEKRPEFELYNIKKDPGCLENLAGRPEVASVQQELSTRLKALLEAQGDPRMFGRGDCFDNSPWVNKLSGEAANPAPPEEGLSQMKFDHSQDREWIY